MRADVDEKMVTAYSRSLRGRPRPQVAAELLAGDAAFKLVIPPQSKAWIAMAPMGLPPTVSAEATLTLGPAWVLCVTITARNEEAAQEWVAKAKEFAEEQNEQLLGKLADESALKELRAALPGGKLNAELAVNGRVVVVKQTVTVQGMMAAMEAWVRKQ